MDCKKFNYLTIKKATKGVFLRGSKSPLSSFLKGGVPAEVRDEIGTQAGG